MDILTDRQRGDNLKKFSTGIFHIENGKRIPELTEIVISDIKFWRFMVSYVLKETHENLMFKNNNHNTLFFINYLKLYVPSSTLCVHQFNRPCFSLISAHLSTSASYPLSTSYMSTISNDLVLPLALSQTIFPSISFLYPFTSSLQFLHPE